MSSIVPPKEVLCATRETANARRRIIFEESPPTLIATKFPGLHLSTRSPTLISIWWYCPTSLFPTIVARNCAAFLFIEDIRIATNFE